MSTKCRPTSDAGLRSVTFLFIHIPAFLSDIQVWITWRPGRQHCQPFLTLTAVWYGAESSGDRTRAPCPLLNAWSTSGGLYFTHYIRNKGGPPLWCLRGEGTTEYENARNSSKPSKGQGFLLVITFLTWKCGRSLHISYSGCWPLV